LWVWLYFSMLGCLVWHWRLLTDSSLPPPRSCPTPTPFPALVGGLCSLLGSWRLEVGVIEGLVEGCRFGYLPAVPPIGEWIDFAFLRACSLHASGSVAAMGSFKLTALLTDHLVEEMWLKAIVHWIEGLTLVGLLVWLAYQLGVLLWNRRVGHGQLDVFLAA
jgi:hypothetical protein